MITFAKILFSSLIIFVVTTNQTIGNAFSAFIFAGVIPGTSYELPFWAMSLLLFMVGYGAIRWISKQTLYIGDEAHELQLAKAEARSYVMNKIKHKPASIKQRSFRRKRSFRVAPTS